jgi:hypothetical protein
MTDHLKQGHNSEPGFEGQDLRPGAVYTFLIVLAIATIMIAFAIKGVYSFAGYYEKTHQPPQNPMVQPEADTARVDSSQLTKFSQPRLESNERMEINEFRLKEEQQLNSYGWVGESGGAIHIPIDQAMKLVAQRGLSTTPKTGEVPTSSVSVINNAAQHSDTSGMTPEKPQVPQSGKAKQ